jgi:hypothetical protein
MRRTARSIRLAATLFSVSRAAALTAAAALAGAGAHMATGTLAAPPTGVTGTSGVDSATIAFTPSTTTTPPVTSYTVTAYPGAEQGFGATSPVTVTGLQPSTAYTFSVTAASTAGRGPGSLPSTPITTLPVPAGVTPPALSALHASLVSFFAGGAGGRSGTTLSYTDSAAATSTFVVLRVRSGFKQAGGCAIGSRAGKRCTSLLLVGSFTYTDVAGSNQVHFSGRLGGRALPAGLYQVRVTPALNGVSGNTLKTALDVF